MFCYLVYSAYNLDLIQQQIEKLIHLVIWLYFFRAKRMITVQSHKTSIKLLLLLRTYFLVRIPVSKMFKCYLLTPINLCVCSLFWKQKINNTNNPFVQININIGWVILKMFYLIWSETLNGFLKRDVYLVAGQLISRYTWCAVC